MIVQEKKFKVKKKIVVNLDVCREKKKLSKMGTKFISGAEFTMSRPTLMEVLNILL